MRGEVEALTFLIGFGLVVAGVLALVAAWDSGSLLTAFAGAAAFGAGVGVLHFGR